MKPRITINTNKEDQIEIWLNPAGRDQLVEELLALNDQNDHFQFDPREVATSLIAYREGDICFEYGKVYLRQEESDREFYPHVFSKD